MIVGFLYYFQPRHFLKISILLQTFKNINLTRAVMVIMHFFVSIICNFGDFSLFFRSFFVLQVFRYFFENFFMMKARIKLDLHFINTKSSLAPHYSALIIFDRK